jgi:hypothetical protein
VIKTPVSIYSARNSNYTNYFSEAVLEMESVWICVNVDRQRLLLLKAYKDALSFANIVDQPPTSKFGLEDEPGSNLDDLEAYRSVIANGEQVPGSNPLLSYNNNSIVEELFFFLSFSY